MAEANISQEIRLEKIDETMNYFLEEIKQKELMSKKHKQICTTINSIEYFLILVSVISAFSSLIGISNGITSSTVGLKVFATTAGTKKYKSVTMKKEKEAL